MNTRTIPTSYSGQMDVILNPRRKWPARPPGREEIRPDIVRAVRLNASIDDLDANGVRCWPTSIRSEPVYLPLWGAGYDLTCPICGGHMERCDCHKTYKPKKAV